jgi:NAD-dependent SIR2 family protein deacetylase
MPIREYKTVQPGRCLSCKNGFEHREPPNQAPLKNCPKCGRPVVRKEPISFNQKKLNISTTQAKEAGFKLYKKINHGEYELQ